MHLSCCLVCGYGEVSDAASLPHVRHLGLAMLLESLLTTAELNAIVSIFEDGHVPVLGARFILSLPLFMWRTREC